MARYDYVCHNKDCENVTKLIEIDKKISDYERLEPCPGCGTAMKPLPPSKTGFTLKGSGWYSSDYKGNRH